MTFLGDLERFAATSIHPWRFVIVALAIVVAVGLVVLAARRGWLSAARRHPGRTGVIVAVLLVVLAPAAWVLGSPLFVRTELQEPGPVATMTSPVPGEVAPTSAPAPPSAPSNTALPAANPTPTMPATVPTPTTGPVTRSGTFVGADDFHFGRGKATLVEASAGTYTLRFDDFSVRNGPDLFVYLSPDPDGYAEGAIELGRLRATDGSFNTRIPAGTDAGAARSVVIWCKEFAVQFAVAALAG